MSENIASSTWFGGRPSLATTRAYSSRVRPRATASCAVGSVSASGGDTRLHRGRHPGEERESVGGAAHEHVDGVLGVRHQAEHVAALVEDARDGARRAVEGLAVDVAQDDLTLGLQHVELVLR